MRRLAFLVSLLTASTSTAADIKLKLTGTELDGGPAFEVMLGEDVVGKGVVDPLPEKGQFAVFSYQVPNEQLVNARRLSIRMTNDAFKKGVGDRNLIIGSVEVNGANLVPADFKITRNGEGLKRSNGRLSTNSDLAIATAPASGWLGSSAQTEPALPSSTPSQCEAPPIAITNYPNGAVAIDDAQKAIAKSILNWKECRIRVMGYSSTVGSEAVNKQLSSERAEAIASYLVTNGFPRAQLLVSGEGETGEFGPTHADNRRVVVSAVPR